MSGEAMVLLSMIRNDFEQSIDYEIPPEFSWERFFDLINRNRVFIMAYQAIQNQLPKEVDDKFAAHCKRVRDRIELTNKEISHIVEEADKEQVRFLIIKGAAIANQIYGYNSCRQYNDIDLLVEEDDMIRMDHIVRRLGFVQPYNDEGDFENWELLPYPLLIIPEHQHYFEYYKKIGDTYIKVEIARHMHYLVPPLTYDFFWHPEKVVIGTASFLTFSKEYALLNLIANTYKNSEDIYHAQRNCYIRDYIDLHYFLIRNGELIDRERFQQKVNEFCLEEKARIVFENLFSLYEDKESIRYCNLFSPVKKNRKNMYIEWETSFPERIFEGEKRKEETLRHIKNKIFDPDKYLCVDKRYHVSTAFAENNYTTFENRYQMNIGYQIYKGDKAFYFSCRLSKLLFAEFDKYMMELVIYNGDVNNDQLLYSLIDINIIDSKLVSKCFRTDKNNTMHGSREQNCYFGNCEVESKQVDGESMEFKVKIPFEYVDYSDETVQLAYAVRLMKKMKENIYYCKDSTPVLFDAPVLIL